MEMERNQNGQTILENKDGSQKIKSTVIKKGQYQSKKKYTDQQNRI